MWTAGARASLLCVLLFAVTDSLRRRSHAAWFCIHSVPIQRRWLPSTRLLSALEGGLGSKIEVLNEYLELHRFPGEHHAQELSASLRNHYAGQDIHAIVPIAFPALEFFLRYLEGAFPKTPVLFVAVEAHRIRGISLTANITGVTHIDDWGGALREILRMQPDTQEVVLVAGSAATDQTSLEMQKRLLSRINQG